MKRLRLQLALEVGVRDAVFALKRRQGRRKTEWDFSLELCRKPALFDDVNVDQFWMPTSSVYGQAKRRSQNYESIVDLFWSVCVAAGDIEDDVCDSFILAKLLPLARSKGSRRVFYDSKLRLVGKRLHSAIAELDEQLAGCRDVECNVEQFHRGTAIALGSQEWAQAIRDKYIQMTGELFSESREALRRCGNDNPGSALRQWQKWMNSLGRHKGHEMEKLILDVLSYECRAAIHRCYSATWCLLLPFLTTEYELSPESQVFHQLWHLDLCSRPDGEAARFHLFHGHVFALHPAIAMFVVTKTGSTLLGAYLRNPKDQHAYGRLLNGIMLAANAYAIERASIADSRRKTPKSASIDLESLSQKRIRRDRRRRRKS